MPQLGDYVLVCDVVYKLVDLDGRRREHHYRWMRNSIPPELPQPGKRFPWPANYRLDRLPAHEVISAERAEEIKREAHDRFNQRVKS